MSKSGSGQHPLVVDQRLFFFNECNVFQGQWSFDSFAYCIDINTTGDMDQTALPTCRILLKEFKNEERKKSEAPKGLMGHA